MQDLSVALFWTSSPGRKTVGAAYIDPFCKFGLGEFFDNDRFSAVESLLLQLGASEVIMPPDSSKADEAASNTDHQKILQILEKCGCNPIEAKRAIFTPKSTCDDIMRLTGAEALVSVDPTNKHALSAGAALLKHHGLLSDSEALGKYTLVGLHFDKFMSLDAAAVRALNLFDSGVAGGPKTLTLCGLLDQCRTAMGSHMLQRWIRQPLCNVEEIERRLDLVEIFLERTHLRHALQEQHLRGVPDLGRIASKFVRGKGTLQDTVLLYQCVQRLGYLVDVLRNPDAADADEDAMDIETSGAPSEETRRVQHTAILQETFAEPLARLCEEYTNFASMVEATIDLARVEENQYLINPAFDPDLQELADAKDGVLDQIHQMKDEVAADLGLEAAKVKMDSNNVIGHYFRVTRKDEIALRRKPLYATLETRKDGVRFTNSALRTASKRLAELTRTYDAKQKDLEAKTLDTVASYVPVMEDTADLLARLDLAVAFAHASAHAPIAYVRPCVRPAEDGILEMRAMRHPCLETVEGSFIPNDCVLCASSTSCPDAPAAEERHNFSIITGPNMGGKSTYIRTIGVVTLMAQIGCFVPCASATISVRDRILARVGAGDSLLRGVSTFMAEMLETAAILKAASEKSLIIIDELGRGTSTYDGFGLAWAIAEHIAKDICAPTLFATHFHELTALAQSLPAVANFHVTAHASHDTLTFLYEIRPGPCERSFGIHVAELANFPPDVVAMAKEKLSELEDHKASSAIENRLDQVQRCPLDQVSPEEAIARVSEAMTR